MNAAMPVNPGGFHLQRMRGGFQPIPYQGPARRRDLGQIQINPNIQAPINLSLGSLPLSIGLFAGSGMALLLGSQVKSIQPYTVAAAVALAGFGVVNLIIPKDAPPAPSGPPSPSTVTPGSTSGPIANTPEIGFAGVSGRIITPAYGDTIDAAPWGTPQIPMRVRLTNSSSVEATFDLIISAMETPAPFGAPVSNSPSQRITIPAGETRDVDVSVGILSWDSLVDYVEVDVDVRKRRIDGGPTENLAGVMFVVE